MTATETQIRILIDKARRQDGILTPTETKMLAEWAEIQLQYRRAAHQAAEDAASASAYARGANGWDSIVDPDSV
jgi:hypothetical protein